MNSSWVYKFDNKRRPCLNCGKKYKPGAPNAKYCDDCRVTIYKGYRAGKKKIVVLIIIISLISSTVYAGQRYNPYTNKYETASKGEVLTYNPYENEYTYAYPDNKWEYNPYEDKYEASRDEGNHK